MNLKGLSINLVHMLNFVFIKGKESLILVTGVKKTQKPKFVPKMRVWRLLPQERILPVPLQRLPAPECSNLLFPAKIHFGTNLEVLGVSGPLWPK